MEARREPGLICRLEKPVSYRPYRSVVKVEPPSTEVSSAVCFRALNTVSHARLLFYIPSWQRRTPFPLLTRCESSWLTLPRARLYALCPDSLERSAITRLQVSRPLETTVFFGMTHLQWRIQFSYSMTTSSSSTARLRSFGNGPSPTCPFFSLLFVIPRSLQLLVISSCSMDGPVNQTWYAAPFPAY